MLSFLKTEAKERNSGQQRKDAWLSVLFTSLREPGGPLPSSKHAELQPLLPWLLSMLPSYPPNHLLPWSKPLARFAASTAAFASAAAFSASLTAVSAAATPACALCRCLALSSTSALTIQALTSHAFILLSLLTTKCNKTGKKTAIYQEEIP